MQDQEKSAILLFGNDKKSEILKGYLEASGINIFSVKTKDDLLFVLQERKIHYVFVPFWCKKIEEIQGIINEIRNNLNLSAGLRQKIQFVLFVEELMLEDDVLSPWDMIINLPEEIFYFFGDDKRLSMKPRLIDHFKKNILTRLFPSPFDKGNEKAYMKDNVHVPSNGEPSHVEIIKGKGETSKLDKGFSDFIFNSRAIQDVFDRALLVAPTEATILITGASGTGKELVSNMIHENSPRKGKNFLRINCASIAKNIIESELFGYEKGAFTGAITRKKGYFEAADGGTIFLDEIAELELSLQAKLLRVLEYGEVIRVGAVEPIYVNVRLVAATNRDLKDEVKKGNFREDLFYRLNVIKIFIPPLKERREDIPPLFNHYMDIFNKKYNKNINAISVEAKRILLNYQWPGNVRELKNLIEGLVILKKGKKIELYDFPIEMREASVLKLDWVGSHTSIPIKAGIPLKLYEMEIIRENLRLCHGNRKDCAGILGISERTLYRKIKEYNLEE